MDLATTRFSLTPNLTSTSVVALAEISKITGNKFLYNIPTRGAFSYFNGDNPYVTCEGATKNKAVILLKLSDKTEVYSEGECIIVQGTDEDEIIKAATRLILKVLSIVK